MVREVAVDMSVSHQRALNLKMWKWLARRQDEGDLLAVVTQLYVILSCQLLVRMWRLVVTWKQPYLLLNLLEELTIVMLMLVEIVLSRSARLANTCDQTLTYFCFRENLFSGS